MDDKPPDCCYVYQGDIIIRHAGFMQISDIVNKEGCTSQNAERKNAEDYFPNVFLIIVSHSIVDILD